MATCIRPQLSWPVLCGLTRCIVAKPSVDRLEISTVSDRTPNWVRIYLFQIVQERLLLSLCNLSYSIGDSGNEFRARFIVTAVTSFKVFIAGFNEYIAEGSMNPTSIWRHGNGWSRVKINKVLNSDGWNGYPRFIYCLSATQQSTIHNSGN